MLFAYLFIFAFLFSAILYFIVRKWWVCVGAPVILFGFLLVGYEAQSGFFASDSFISHPLIFGLTFGLCIVFFAGLLGCYVVQLRFFDSKQNVSEKEVE